MAFCILKDKRFKALAERLNLSEKSLEEFLFDFFNNQNIVEKTFGKVLTDNYIKETYINPTIFNVDKTIRDFKDKYYNTTYTFEAAQEQEFQKQLNDLQKYFTKELIVSYINNKGQYVLKVANLAGKEIKKVTETYEKVIKKHIKNVSKVVVKIGKMTSKTFNKTWAKSKSARQAVIKGFKDAGVSPVLCKRIMNAIGMNPDMFDGMTFSLILDKISSDKNKNLRVVYNESVDLRIDKKLEDRLFKILDKYGIEVKKDKKANIIEALKKTYADKDVAHFQHAVYDSLNKVIYLARTRNKTTVPEEFSHAFVELMSVFDEETFNTLMNEVEETDTYKQVYLTYSTIYVDEEGNPDYNHIKREAIGLALAGALLNEWESKTGENTTAEQDSKNRSFLLKLKDWFNKLISKFTKAEKLDTFDKILRDTAKEVLTDQGVKNKEFFDKFDVDVWNAYQNSKKEGNQNLFFQVFKPGVNDIILNAGLKEAIAKIINYIKSPQLKSTTDYFLLDGRAGTGKTTIINYILKQYGEEYSSQRHGTKLRTLIGAPSNKAKMVLNSKISKEVKDIVVVSAQSFAGMSGKREFVNDANSKDKDPNIDENKNKPIRDAEADYSEANAPSKQLLGADVVIIDEASMLKDSDLTFIHKFKELYPNKAIILIGDSGQIRPVKGERNEKGLAQIAKVFKNIYNSTDSNKEARYHRLTEAVRQGKDNPIVDFSNNYYEMSTDDEDEMPLPDVSTYVTRIPKSNNKLKGATIFRNSRSSNIIDDVLPLIKKGLKQKNPNLVRIVTYTNAAKSKYNTEIRKRIYGDKYQEHPMVGDIITLDERGMYVPAYDKYGNIITDKDGNQLFVTVDNSADGIVVSSNNIRQSEHNYAKQQVRLMKFLGKLYKILLDNNLHNVVLTKNSLYEKLLKNLELRDELDKIFPKKAGNRRGNYVLTINSKGNPITIDLLDKAFRLARTIATFPDFRVTLVFMDTEVSSFDGKIKVEIPFILKSDISLFKSQTDRLNKAVVRNNLNEFLYFVSPDVDSLPFPKNTRFADYFFLEYKNSYGLYDYGYAITGHKAQGSTYETSVIDADDMLKRGREDNNARASMIYTAITRASNTTVMYHSDIRENTDSSVDLIEVNNEINRRKDKKVDSDTFDINEQPVNPYPPVEPEPTIPVIPETKPKENTDELTDTTINFTVNGQQKRLECRVIAPYKNSNSFAKNGKLPYLFSNNLAYVFNRLDEKVSDVLDIDSIPYLNSNFIDSLADTPKLRQRMYALLAYNSLLYKNAFNSQEAVLSDKEIGAKAMLGVMKIMAIELAKTLPDNPMLKAMDEMNQTALYNKQHITFDDVDPLTEEEHVYKIDGVPTDTTVTKWTSEYLGLDTAITNSNPIVGGRIGTLADKILREKFAGTFSTANYSNISSTFADYMQSVYKDIKKSLDKDFGEGQYITITDEDSLRVGGSIVVERNGRQQRITIAGTMDMIVIDKNGNKWLYDFKTNKANRHVKITDAYNKESRYGIQVELYEALHNANNNIKIQPEKKLWLINYKSNMPTIESNKFSGSFINDKFILNYVKNDKVLTYKTPVLALFSERPSLYKDSPVYNNSNRRIDASIIDSIEGLAASDKELKKVLPEENKDSYRTKEYNITIDTKLKTNWLSWLNSNPNGIVAYRAVSNYNSSEAVLLGVIGNPFDWTKPRYKDTYKGEHKAAKCFYNWLTKGTTYDEPLANEEYRQAIINKILNSDENTPILYYKDIPKSHAHIIGYLIRHKNELRGQVKKAVLTTINFEELDDIINKRIEISTSGYRKGDPQRNPTVAYVFTENALAAWASGYIRIYGAGDFGYSLLENPKLNVSDVNGTNQAGIRTDSSGNLSKNAFGIVVKKAQLDNNGRWLAKEGLFQDTDEDFEMFTNANKEVFDELEKSGLTNIMFPSQMALGKSALPIRFAEWLQQQLLQRFNIEATISKNTRSGYDGFGLELKSINTSPVVTSTTVQKPNTTDKLASNFVMHSGGALGSDYNGWDLIGREYGLSNINHYYYGVKDDKNAPYGNVEISDEDYNEGVSKAALAAQRNFGYTLNYVKDPRLIRNWAQVKYADAIFAIGTIALPGEKAFPNKKNDTRIAVRPMVTGGTGYAVGMAILNNKPVYVFDLNKKQWYTWSDEDDNFVAVDTPVLTPNFAGIGTREINESGKQAIRDVYENTIRNYDGAVKQKQVVDGLEAELGSDDRSKQEIKDAIAYGKKGITFEEALRGQESFFTEEELEQIKQALNGRPLLVASVSRDTDPAFFADRLIEKLKENAKKPLTDPTRINALELWTKHDGLPIRRILEACKEYKVAPMVSFSITSMGDTPLEKGVMRHDDLLDRIEKLVKVGVLNPVTTTIRIDPILVGYTNMDDVRHIVERAKKIGMKKFVSSLMLSYGYTENRITVYRNNKKTSYSLENETDIKTIQQMFPQVAGVAADENDFGKLKLIDNNGKFIELSGVYSDDRRVVDGIDRALAKEGQTYDWDKYYGRDRNGKVNFIPKQQYIDEIGKVLLEIAEDPEIEYETCSFTIKGLKPSACLDPLIIERVVGIDITRPDNKYDEDTSRKLCMCYAHHGNFFDINGKCYSACGYCYRAHSGDSAFDYYDSNGDLIESNFTRTEESTVEEELPNMGLKSDENNNTENDFGSKLMELKPFIITSSDGISKNKLYQGEYVISANKETYKAWLDYLRSNNMDIAESNMKAIKQQVKKLPKSTITRIELPTQIDSNDEAAVTILKNELMLYKTLRNNKELLNLYRSDSKDATVFNIKDNKLIVEKARELGLIKEDAEEFKMYGFIHGKTAEEVRDTYSLDKLINGAGSKQVRALSIAAIYKMSEYITMIQDGKLDEFLNLSNMNSSMFTEKTINSLKELQGKSRVEIIRKVSLPVLFEFVRMNYFDTREGMPNNDRLRNLSVNERRQMKTINDNFMSFIKFGYSTLTQLEGISVTERESKSQQELILFDGEDLQLIQERFGSSLEHWQVGFRNVSAYTSMSALLRNEMEKFKKLDSNNDVVYNSIGLEERVDSSAMVAKILHWTQGCKTLDEMIQKLENHVVEEPWLLLLVNKNPNLKDSKGRLVGIGKLVGVDSLGNPHFENENFRSLFFNNMYKYFQKYGIVYLEGSGDNAKVHIKMLNDEANTTQVYDETMGYLRTLSKEQFADIKETLSLISFGDNVESNELAANIETLLNNLGIHRFNSEQILSLVELSGTVEIIKRKALGIKSNINNNVVSRKKTKEDIVKSILSDVRELIKLFSDFIEHNAESTFYQNGKVYYSYVLPSYTSRTINQIKTNRLAVAEELKQSDFLWDGEKFRHNFLERLLSYDDDVKIFDHKVQLNDRGNSYVDKSPKQYYSSILHEYFYDINNLYAWYRMPILSNKPTEEYLKFTRISKGFETTITNYFVDITMLEIDRIADALTRAKAIMDGTMTEAEKVKYYDMRVKKGDKISVKLLLQKHEGGARFVIIDYLQDYLDSYINKNDDEPLTEQLLLGKMLYDLIIGNSKDSQNSTFLKQLKVAIKNGMDAKFEELKQSMLQEGALYYKEDRLQAADSDILGVSPEEIEDNLREFFWNDTYMSMGIQQLFVTDPVYYDNAEELQKRLAQLHAPGSALNLDAIDIYNSKDKQITKYSDGKFRFVVIKDDKIPSEAIENINDIFDDILRKYVNNRPAQEYYNRLRKNIVNALSRVNVADAQTLCAPTAMRKRLGMLGEWTDEREAAYQKILDGDFSQSNLLAMMQPTKPFLYGQRIMKNTHGTMRNFRYGVLMKTSEYMIVLADAILRGAGRENTKLSTIFDVLEESLTTVTADNKRIPNTKGIDAICFESAIKTGLSGVVDLNGNLQPSEIRKRLEDAIYAEDKNSYNTNHVYEMSFADYGIQLAVPAHFEGEQQRGSQVTALIFADLLEFERDSEGNIKLDDNGNPIEHVISVSAYNGVKLKTSVSEAKQEYFELISKNIDFLTRELVKLLKLDDEDLLIQNIAISRLLRELILNDGRFGSDLYWACSTDADGNFNIPLSDSTQASRVSLLLHAIIKDRVYKQPMHGGPVVLVANWGTGEDLKIRYTNKFGQTILTEEEWKSYMAHPSNQDRLIERHGEIAALTVPGVKLRSYKAYYDFHMKDGGMYYECYAPIFDKALLKYMNKNGVIDIVKIRKEQPQLLELIGYRIPTEAKYSMASLRIVGFLPREAGEGIMLPKEWTAFSGSDYDVDKLYIMRRSYQYDESKGRWIKGCDPNFKENEYYRNNDRIFDLMLGVLESELGRMLATKVGNFDTLKKMAYLTTVLRDNANTVTDSEKLETYDLIDSQLLNGALSLEDLKKRAVTNKNLAYIHTQIQFFKLNMAAGEMIGVFAQANISHAYMSMYQEAKKKINPKFDGIPINIDHIPFSIDNHSSKDKDGKIHIDRMFSFDGGLMSDKLAECIGAAVDASKDPTFNQLGINMKTVNTFVTLIRMGYSIEQICLLFTLPAVQKIINDLSNSEYMEFSDALSFGIQEYITNNGLVGVSPNNKILSSELKDNFVKLNPIVELNALNILLSASKIAEEIRSVIHMTRYNSITAALGPEFIDTILDEMKTESFNNSLGRGDKNEDLTDAVNNPILRSFRNNSKNVADAIFGSRIILYKTNFKLILSKWMKREGVDPNSVSRRKAARLAKFYMNYIVQTLNPLFDLSDEHRKEVITTYPHKILLLKDQDKYKNNIFIQSLKPELNNNDLYVSINIETANITGTMLDNLKSGFDDLAKEDSNMALSIIEYMYFRGGFEYNPKTFTNLITYYIKTHIFAPYIENLKTLEASNLVMTEEEQTRLLNQFMLNDLSITGRPKDFPRGFKPKDVDIRKSKSYKFSELQPGDLIFLKGPIGSSNNIKYGIYQWENSDNTKLILFLVDSTSKIGSVFTVVELLGGNGLGLELDPSRNVIHTIYEKKKRKKNIQLMLISENDSFDDYQMSMDAKVAINTASDVLEVDVNNFDTDNGPISLESMVIGRLNDFSEEKMKQIDEQLNDINNC